jgi:hypothetical protein
MSVDFKLGLDRDHYKDFTEPINNALERAAFHARGLYDQRESSKILQVVGLDIKKPHLSQRYIWFLLEVKKEAPWDIKGSESWNKTIAENTYPGFGEKVYYEGSFMTPEELGNYTYGYIGAALGVPLPILLGASYVVADASLFKYYWKLFVDTNNLKHEIDELKNEYKDWDSIKKGYNAYR